MRQLRSILSSLLVTLLVLLQAFLLTVCFTFNRIRLNLSEAIFDYRIYSITSESMEPAIKQGDIIIVRMCAPEDVQVGDVITTSLTHSTVLTQRLVRILTEWNGEAGLWFITKGDAKIVKNPPISADQLIGKVTGRLANMGWILSSRWLLPIMLLVNAVCWGLTLFMLQRLVHRRDREKP